jgi:hydrogenase expression/formation protein HypC
MQVIGGDAMRAQCRNGDSVETVDMMLLGEQPPGTWVQVFLGSARERISAEQAKKIQQALQSVEQIMRGEDGDVDALFADLIDREPTLPPHLQPSKSA